VSKSCGESAVIMMRTILKALLIHLLVFIIMHGFLPMKLVLAMLDFGLAVGPWVIYNVILPGIVIWILQKVLWRRGREAGPGN